MLRRAFADSSVFTFLTCGRVGHWLTGTSRSTAVTDSGGLFWGRSSLPGTRRRIATIAMPMLTFWERNAPFSVLAAARVAQVPVNATPDPKGTKETVATLTVDG